MKVTAKDPAKQPIADALGRAMTREFERHMDEIHMLVPDEGCAVCKALGLRYPVSLLTPFEAGNLDSAPSTALGGGGR